MKHSILLKYSVIATGMLCGTASHATVIGFGQLGGSNTTIPGDLASNATADGNGFVVTNGATPNIALTWDSDWDIHTSGFFSDIEDFSVGGGDWDNEGDIPRIAQLDFGNHTIAFSADPGFALSLNSFDFGHQPETAGVTEWDLSLTDSGSNVVWSQSVTLDNADPSTGITTVTPNFTGDLGESYTLTFDRTSETYGSNGRHALDNLSFNQIPEPSSVSLLGLTGISLLVRRRK